jgi:uncharacterized membrane protein
VTEPAQTLSRRTPREDQSAPHRLGRGCRAVDAVHRWRSAAPKPKFEAEKCYGVVKAGKNDCQTANSSCAGTSKRDNQNDAWIYVPAGSCDKLVGASKQPKKA